MRRNHTPAVKAQVVQELLKEEKTISQLAAEHGLHPNLLFRWREVALKGLPALFSAETAHEQAARNAAHAQETHELYAAIGRLTTELSWRTNKSGQLDERR